MGKKTQSTERLGNLPKVTQLAPLSAIHCNLETVNFNTKVVGE